MAPARARTRARKALTAVAVLGVCGAASAGGVALSGCGAAATLDPIARAAEVTSQQEGAKIALTFMLSSSALPGGSLTIAANGYVDERRHTSEMSMDLSGLPGASALPEGGTGTVQMIYQYPVVYMNMPFLAGKLPAGKTWVKLDLSKVAQAAGIDLSQLSSFNETDPSQIIEYLRASSGGVSTVGSETVDGVPTTHYHGVLQVSTILERLPADAQTAAKAALQKLGEDGAIPVDVWVDSQHRVRRVTMSLGGGADSATGAPAFAGTVTIDYTSYGPIPPITAPPAEQVFDLTSLATSGIEAGQS
jgi:hypothetical protein